MIEGWQRFTVPLVGAAGLLMGLALAVSPTLALVAAGGLVGGFVLLASPVAAALAVFGAVLVAAQGLTAVQVAGLPLTAAKVAVVAALGGHVLRAVTSGRALVHRSPLTAPALAMLAVMFASLGGVQDLRLASVEIAGTVMLLVMMHLMSSSLRPEHLPALFRGMGVVTASSLLLMAYLGRDIDLERAAHEVWSARSAGGFLDPNLWAAALVLTMPPVAGALAADDRRFTALLLMGVLVAVSVAVVQSMSRAGIVALAATGPGLLWLLRHRWRWLLVAAGGAFSLAPMFVRVDAVVLRWQTLIDPHFEAGIGGNSLRERELLLQTALEVIWDHPILGVGIGQFPSVAEHYTHGLVAKIAHNTYLQIAAEMGLPGVLVHLWLAAVMMRVAWGVATRATTPMVRGFGGGMIVGWMGFAVMALTLNLATFTMLWLFLGLLGVAWVEVERADALAAPPAAQPRVPRMARAA